MLHYISVVLGFVLYYISVAFEFVLYYITVVFGFVIYTIVLIDYLYFHHTVHEVLSCFLYTVKLAHAVTLGQNKIYVCLGFPYLPYFFALKNAYPNIFMVILA